MHEGICSESSERGEEEEAPSGMLGLVECRLAFCSSLCAFKVENLISVLCRERGDWPEDVCRPCAECSRLPKGFKVGIEGVLSENGI